MATFTGRRGGRPRREQELIDDTIRGNALALDDSRRARSRLRDAAADARRLAARLRRSLDGRG